MGVLETSLSRLTQVEFWAGYNEENELPVPGVNMKYCFLNIIEDEIWEHQEAENEFLVPFDQLIRRFIDLKKFAFSVR